MLKRALGLMSGTSLDGIDIALIETDGEDQVRRLAGDSIPYPERFRGQLRQALADAAAIVARHERPGCLAAVETELTRLHAAAVLSFLSNRMLQPSAIDVIGFHGQTVLHRRAVCSGTTGPMHNREQDDHGAASRPNPHRPGIIPRTTTVQLGDGPALARLTGIDVVYDLRAADCDNGGQGAPLVPVYHRALASRIGQRPLAFVNIGGVANITLIGRGGELIAFDTGPGNALIDDWVRQHTGANHDHNGALAARGKVHEDYVSHYLRHDHFAAQPPKSLDRNAFSLELVAPLSLEDGAATLTAFTAAAIARAREWMAEEPALWVICGGGRRNRTLMAMLAERVENAVVPAEAVQLDGDTLEAEAWAYLAVRSLAGLAITFPGTTGVAAPTRGGVLARAP